LRAGEASARNKVTRSISARERFYEIAAGIYPIVGM
jgi:hypothetical protein